MGTNKRPLFNRYKFYKTNLWGKIFSTKDFREKEVLFARINRRATTRALEVNPVKLRQKRLSAQGRGLFTKYLIKRYYFNYKEYQFRRIYRNKINKKLPYYRSLRRYRTKTLLKKSDLRNNSLIGTLESNVASILLRSGFFKTPHQIRHAIKHRELMIDGKVVTSLRSRLKVGQHLSFSPELKKYYKSSFVNWLLQNAKKRYVKFNRYKKRKLGFSLLCRFISPIRNARYVTLNPANASMFLLYKPQARYVHFPFKFDVRELNAHYKNL